jgi:hypothetical protein
MRLVTALLSAALDTAELRKARGAFFTPDRVARHITDWAVRSTSDRRQRSSGTRGLRGR